MIQGDNYGNWIIDLYNFIFKRKVKFKKRTYSNKTSVSVKDAAFFY